MGGKHPAYIQNLDGNGTMLRVKFITWSYHVAGNYSPEQLPVTDVRYAHNERQVDPDGR